MSGAHVLQQTCEAFTDLLWWALLKADGKRGRTQMHATLQIFISFSFHFTIMCYFLLVNHIKSQQNTFNFVLVT